MKQAIKMPGLSEAKKPARLVKWLRQAGERVKVGDAIAEVETDKAVMEVEALHEGYLTGPLAEIDHDMAHGETIGYIAGSAAEARAAGVTERQAIKAARDAEKAAKDSVTRRRAPKASSVFTHGFSARKDTGGAQMAAPSVQAELQTWPASLPNSVVNSVVAPGMNTAAVPAAMILAEGPPYHLEQASANREAHARHMTNALATPSFRTTALLHLSALQGAAHEKHVPLSLLFVRACARIIRTHPLFNAAYADGTIAKRERIDIGVGIDGPEGLVMPVLRDVASRTLGTLSIEWRTLRDRVKARRIAPADCHGATFYVVDLENFPIVYSFDSLVPPGASAILCVASGRMKGALATLTCDHRLIVANEAARFLEALADLLSAPAKLFD